jgi:hypothetical protein
VNEGPVTGGLGLKFRIPVIQKGLNVTEAVSARFPFGFLQYPWGTALKYKRKVNKARKTGLKN